MTREQMIEKAREMCEKQYREARMYEKIDCKQLEKNAIMKWSHMCMTFAELFEMDENYFFGI